MNSGMNASGGSGRSTSMTGSTRCRTTRLADMPAPSATPIAVPAGEADQDPAQAGQRVDTTAGLPCAG